jgi:hypothetical protein
MFLQFAYSPVKFGQALAEREINKNSTEKSFMVTPLENLRRTYVFFTHLARNCFLTQGDNLAKYCKSIGLKPLSLLN